MMVDDHPWGFGMLEELDESGVAQPAELAEVETAEQIGGSHSLADFGTFDLLAIVFYSLYVGHPSQEIGFHIRHDDGDGLAEATEIGCPSEA